MTKETGARIASDHSFASGYKMAKLEMEMENLKDAQARVRGKCELILETLADARFHILEANDDTNLELFDRRISSAISQLKEIT